MVIKCKIESKHFYKYINEKTKCKETIDKIIKGEKIYQTAEGLSEIMNENFKSIFTEEETYRTKHGSGAWGIPRSSGAEIGHW